MRHFVENRRPHPPIHDYDLHSRFLVVLIVLLHPVMAIFSLNVAQIISTVIREFVVGLAYVHSADDAALAEPASSSFVTSPHLYPTIFALTLISIAVFSGVFRLFRINQFWPNFIVSLLILVVSLIAFAGGNIAGLFG